MGAEVKMKPSLLSGAQIRAARALLKWSAADLARQSSLGVNTVRRAEVAEGKTSLTAANEFAIRRAFEFAGVEFIEENGGGPGVRLRRRRQKKKLARTNPAELETSVTALVRGILVELVSEESTGRSLERQERDLRAQIRNFSAGDRLSRGGCSLPATDAALSRISRVAPMSDII
jgi:hypothetical protein